MTEKKLEVPVNNSIYILFSEYLFILLPFIVFAIVKTHNDSLSTLFHAPDWSFAASILWGQTIVKLVSGGINNSVIWQRTTLIISAIIVLGLIPSLVTLTLMLITTPPSISFVYFQMILFVLSTLVFFTIGKAGQVLLDESK